MLMRILRAPRRPATPPVAGPVPGLMLSLSAHTALLVAVAGGGAAGARAAAATRDRPTASDGEQLHWVGLETGGNGSGTPRRAPRPGARPPLAFLVPGRAGTEADARGLRAVNARGPGGRTPGNGGSPQDRGVRHSAAPRRPDAAGPRLMRLGAAALPAVPQVELARLVAGVLAAAPDLARRVSRPEDFLPTLVAPGADLLRHVGAQALAAVPVDAHATVLPIPLLGNPTPAYPSSLERAGVGGRVVVEFLIDSTGVVDVGSVRMVESTGPLFADAVRRVLPRLHFLPGQLGAQAVGVTVRQPFLFAVRGGA